MFHGIAGVPTAIDGQFPPYDDASAVVTDDCPTARDVNVFIQWLAVQTGGLRFPVCQLTSFDSVFNRVAGSVIDTRRYPVSSSSPDFAPMAWKCD
ncbi:MAG: hypothetical protein AAGA56_26035 [Myxococcota bacterium]